MQPPRNRFATGASARRKITKMVKRVARLRQTFWRDTEIRDADISALLSCDLALFNYDGCELDSGTVVEFMFAKFADIPSVLLRTDFRAGGDSGENPWNLMTSYYPRTETLVLDAAKIYASCDRDYRKAATEIAGKVVEKLEFLSHTAPAMPARLRPAVSEWLSKLPSA